MKWDYNYCKNCVHYCTAEVDQDKLKGMCKSLNSAMYDGKSMDGQLCEEREIREKR